MTDGEICRNFLSSRFRRKQIKILAQLTLRKPEEIKAVLVAGGIDPLAADPKPNMTTCESSVQCVSLPAYIRKEVEHDEYYWNYKRRHKRF